MFEAQECTGRTFLGTFSLLFRYNKDSKLLENCKPLEEYTLFVEAVRRHIRLDAENGFKNAIKECIQNDILKNYLERKSREVR